MKRSTKPGKKGNLSAIDLTGVPQIPDWAHAIFGAHDGHHPSAAEEIIIQKRIAAACAEIRKRRQELGLDRR